MQDSLFLLHHKSVSCCLLLTQQNGIYILYAGSSFLRNLHGRFRAFAVTYQIPVLSFGEKLPTNIGLSIKTFIVPKMSSRKYILLIELLYNRLSSLGYHHMEAFLSISSWSFLLHDLMSLCFCFNDTYTWVCKWPIISRGVILIYFNTVICCLRLGLFKTCVLHVPTIRWKLA